MRLLLLAGTGAARTMARELADISANNTGFSAIASLAGATREPAPLAIETRIGGFGGDDGFRAYLRDERIDAVLDATHPFATRISARTYRICRENDVPYCQYVRPEWVAEPGDNWTSLANERDAAAHIAHGAVVFLATGRQTLDRFSNLDGRRVICRQIDPPNGPFPFSGGEFLIGRPPFSVLHEEALFRELSVDWLIVKNAGGDAPKSKLIAARNLGIRVGMIARAAPIEAANVRDVDSAMEWVCDLI